MFSFQQISPAGTIVSSQIGNLAQKKQEAKKVASEEVELLDPSTASPEKMVGVRVSIKWTHDKWFAGVITEYNGVDKLHCVQYDDETKGVCG